MFYPRRIIVVIDDNSKQEYVKADRDYENVIYIASIFPGRGELLPFYYFYTYPFFEKAIFLHDSVFFQKKIPFHKMVAPVMPLWHFVEDIGENFARTQQLLHMLKHRDVYHISNQDDMIDTMKQKREWYGCFGVQCVIYHSFLVSLQKKYDLFRLLPVIQTRSDRCCLERILGILFFKECPRLLHCPSLLGSIRKYMKWGFSIEDYERNRYRHSSLPLVKVWTGR